MAIAFGFAGCPDGNNGGDPDLTGTVSITGTARVGQTLTADTSALGGNGTIAYQWKRTKDGTTTDIGTNSTYAVPPADEGFTITVTVTLSGFSGSKACGSTASVTAAGAGDTDLTGTVSISGTARVGETLTADTTALGGEGTITYQWKRTKDGTTTNIGTDSTYLVQAADEGSTITVTVTRSGFSGNKTSGPTATVTAEGTPDLTGEVSISGTAKVGETLTAVTTALEGEGEITYLWKRISGETITDIGTDSTYLVQAADAGSTITVTVTRSGFSGSKTSEPVEIKLLNLSGTVTISPDTDVETGTELTATYSGSETVTFQWKKDGNNIGTAATTTNPNKFTPDETGEYTVTVNATGYNSKPGSDKVTVTAHDYEWGEWGEIVPGLLLLLPTDPSFIEEKEEPGTCKHNDSHKTTRPVPTRPINNVYNWEEALSEISEKGNVGDYTLTLDSITVPVQGLPTLTAANVQIRLDVSPPPTFSTTPNGSKLTITLKGTGKLSFHNQSNSGNLIRIGANQTLIIDSEDLTLEGRQNNNDSLVYVETGGKLELKNGTITGNTASGGDSRGGGVYVAGTFTMSGGEISGNTVTGDRANSTYFGGGVYVAGTFTMEDGKISGNTSKNTGTRGGDGGGGVYVAGTFSMSGGEISDNTATYSGGGVRVAGTFTMEDGKISGNTATSSDTSRGGGVYVNGTFIMKGKGEKGGEISGNTATTGGGAAMNGSLGPGETPPTFRIVTGTIYGSNAVDASLRNTATLYAAFSGSGTPQRGTFTGEGGGWVPKATVYNSDDTVKVKDGDIVPYP
jgi:hypothetical protein